MTNPTEADTLFAHALRDNSNLELDWLWAAEQLIDPAQQRWCLERALVINPASRVARQALALLGDSGRPSLNMMNGRRAFYGERETR